MRLVNRPIFSLPAHLVSPIFPPRSGFSCYLQLICSIPKAWPPPPLLHTLRWFVPSTLIWAFLIPQQWQSAWLICCIISSRRSIVRPAIHTFGTFTLIPMSYCSGPSTCCDLYKLVGSRPLESVHASKPFSSSGEGSRWCGEFSTSFAQVSRDGLTEGIFALAELTFSNRATTTKKPYCSLRHFC